MEQFFTYRNLGGNYDSLGNDVRLGTPTAVFGVSEPHKYLLSALPEQKILYITSDGVSAAKAYSYISALSGKSCAHLCAKDEVILYKDALSKDTLYKRLSAIHSMCSGARIVVADVESVMQLFPAQIDFINFEVGRDYDYSAIPQKLVQMGYTREYSVDSKGSFAVRGDILDLYPINCDNPVRIDFFGDTVEKIRPYDTTSGERLEEVKAVCVVAATDVSYTAEDIKRVKAEISDCLKNSPSEALRRARAVSDDIFIKLDSGAPFAGASFVMPLLGCARTVFDILDKDTIIVFDECKLINDTMNGIYKEHSQRVQELKKAGEAFNFSLAQLIAPEALYEGFKKFRCLALQTFTTSTQFFAPLKTYNFTSSPAPSYLNAMPQLITDLKNWLSNGYRVLIYTGGIQRYEKLAALLTDEYLPVYPVPDRLEALRGVSITSEEMPHGLILHESKLVILGSGDLYTKAVTKRIKRKRGDMFTAPEIGDYAVHEKHGIGKITGTKKIETTDGIKEYVAIEYKGGDVLYVPVEQMDVLSKYVGETNPPLSKIGGADFDRIKERVKRSIRALAFDLKQLYKERGEKRGFKFPENSVMMQEFEDAFIYEETPDQLASVEEIKADMCSEKVMDRLLCGDVGFGKTEVALRAVYLCVLGGRQAALMCPGTVLSEQHFNTALERFKDFGVKVEKLNRFKTPKQQAETLKRLADGDIDFIVGTHRLLSDDVKFDNLGLLVLDEEQRFGVEHKEKIKHLKSDIDCLTMTATPIPRTLHMSLSGIRDISTINTPPQKRLPVQTYVVEETEALIRDACIRELSRGGQLFILYNRVETISSFAGKIAEIVPEGKVCYAHGRMERDSLENSVFSFYRGEKNILVTTTIIENGIDLPNANTIIVIDA
ncbi:MAG: DEAD/DEAH box helicase, partial [Clostridia bacterium]|nr:DEAD/DEAH box helicase [Clostridia bacterium]